MSANEAPKVPREVPNEIIKQLKNWQRQAVTLRVFYILLSFSVIGTSITVASRLLDPSGFNMTLVALATALTAGILVFLGLDGKTANMRTAWRILNVAVIRYQTEENFKIEDLNAAYKTGESIIGDVKVNLAK